MKKVHLIYFSPGGTTRKTVRTIASGMGNIEVIEHDMTIMENRKNDLTFKEDELVIFGSMTGTKMYGPMREIFSRLKGNNTPFIGVSLYGNGFFGSSLRDMKKAMESRGFVMSSAGAFIGQYSFTDQIASGRPDQIDMQIQREFGLESYNKIFSKGVKRITSKLPISWPGEGPRSIIKAALIMSKPGVGMTMPKFWNQRSIDENCVECRKCEKHCPMQAIEIDSKSVDIKSCIGCNGCSNVCPTGAIHTTSKTILKMIDTKIKYNKERKEPKLFY